MTATVSAPGAGYERICGAAAGIEWIGMVRVRPTGAGEERERECEAVAVSAVAEDTLEHSLEYVHWLVIRWWLHDC